MCLIVGFFYLLSQLKIVTRSSSFFLKLIFEKIFVQKEKERSLKR